MPVVAYLCVLAAAAICYLGLGVVLPILPPYLTGHAHANKIAAHSESAGATANSLSGAAYRHGLDGPIAPEMIHPALDRGGHISTPVEHWERDAHALHR